MATYSIKDLEQLSGIKAHTIRIWEKRYELFSPDRTDTNIRYYNDDDLRKILNISILNRDGMKISKIADLSEDQLESQVLDALAGDSPVETEVDQLVLAMINMDDEQFEVALDHFIERKGLKDTMIQIVYPYMEKIGVLWQVGSITPAQEHFISNLIRQKLIVEIDKMRAFPPTQKEEWLLYLPEHEMHELGLLFYHYILRTQGYRVTYLGQFVPHTSVQYVLEFKEPEYILCSLICPFDEGNVQEFVNRYKDDAHQCEVYVTGAQTKKLKSTPDNVHVIEHVDQLLAKIRR